MNVPVALPVAVAFVEIALIWYAVSACMPTTCTLCDGDLVASTMRSW